MIWLEKEQHGFPARKKCIHNSSEMFNVIGLMGWFASLWRVMLLRMALFSQEEHAVCVQGFLFVGFVSLTDIASIQRKSVSLVCREELIPFFSSEWLLEVVVLDTMEASIKRSEFSLFSDIHVHVLFSNIIFPCDRKFLTLPDFLEIVFWCCLLSFHSHSL